MNETEVMIVIANRGIVDTTFIVVSVYFCIWWAVSLPVYDGRW